MRARTRASKIGDPNWSFPTHPRYLSKRFIHRRIEIGYDKPFGGDTIDAFQFRFVHVAKFHIHRGGDGVFVLLLLVDVDDGQREDARRIIIANKQKSRAGMKNVAAVKLKTLCN